jgi:hypothetical protein
VDDHPNPEYAEMVKKAQEEKRRGCNCEVGFLEDK